MKPHEHIIAALDVPTIEKAVSLVSLLRNDVGVFKVGLELLNSGGSAREALALLTDAGASRIFLDVKLHDIPNTVSGAMRGIIGSGAWSVTVHTMGGKAMLRAAVETAQREAQTLGVRRTLILGVTVLTSIGQDELRQELQVNSSMADYTIHLALMARDAGCDGVIASPVEARTIREVIPSRSFLIVTPGVRPIGTEHGDQARVCTPAEAIKHGSSYLVLGRPICAALDPVAAARSIAVEIAGALPLAQ